jgi:hypothetical protein
VAFDDTTASVQWPASRRITSTMPGTMAGLYSSLSRSMNAFLTCSLSARSRHRAWIEAKMFPRNSAKYSCGPVSPSPKSSLTLRNTSQDARRVWTRVPSRSNITAQALDRWGMISPCYSTRSARATR